MSMHIWPVSCAGVILADEELYEIFELNKKKCDDEIWNLIYEFVDENVDFNVYDSEDDDGLYFCSYNGEYENYPKQVLFLNSVRQPRLFTTAYQK